MTGKSRKSKGLASQSGTQTSTGDLVGKAIDWVREESTGRLIYRRRYPADVQSVIGKRELKVPLGAKRYLSEAASRTYYRTCERFDREVRDARAALRIKEKEAAAAFDLMTPARIEYLTGVLLHDQRTGMEQRLQGGHGRLAGEAWAWLLPELRNIRLSGDTALLEDVLAPTVDSLLASEGIRLDPTDKEGRTSLLWALNAGIVNAGDDILRHLEGYAPPIPPKPERPVNPKGRARTVSALCDAYKVAKWDGWSESSRNAIGPVLRVLRETIGGREVTKIDREVAREVFEAVKALPVNLGKRAAFAGLTVPQAIAKSQQLGLPTINPNTVNRAYMVQIAAVFNWAVAEDWTVKSPFGGLAMADPVDDKDRREPFTLDQLTTLFSAVPWVTRQPDDARRPGRYWVPLIALYSGMRLGEIAGLRIMDVEEIEGIPALRVRPHEGRGLKTAESRRNVPIHSALIALGLQSFIAHRREGSEPGDLLFPDGKANSRGQGGAKLGEWFSGLLKAREIVGTKLGMHSFRHSFEDRLKAVGLHGRAEGQALGGRKVNGSEGNYGSEFPIGLLQEALEKVSYPGLDLSHLQP